MEDLFERLLTLRELIEDLAHSGRLLLLLLVARVLFRVKFTGALS